MVLAIPVVIGSVPASATGGTAVSAAVEDFAYPGAAQVLADRNIVVKTGDGHIRLADCASGPGLVELYSRSATPSHVCFRITGPTGYLALEIPKVYNIRGDSHTLKATLNTAGSVTALDVNKNDWTPVGESTGDATTLLELTATDGPAGPAGTTDRPAVGTLTVGQAGRADSRGCTATLVDPQWVVTAADCFADNPASVAAGKPPVKSTVTIAGQSAGIIELAPRADRDLVMARLAKSVIGVAPIALATTAPTGSENLQAVGYGRTATDWNPGAPHTATHGVGATTTTGFDTLPAADAAPLCKGDAGAPFLRTVNGRTELAAVVTAVGQSGCLDSTATATGTRSSRTDDLGGWVKQLSISPVHADIPVSGNWDGTGPDNVGIWRATTGDFHLRTDNGDLTTVPWGENGDVPVAGNWDGTGPDNIGIWRPSTGEFQLRMDNGDLVRIGWGEAGDIPVAGNWDGTGPDNIGIWRPSTGEFHLRMDNGDLVRIGWGEAGDIPVAGNWDGTGPDNIGIWRPSVGQFHLRMDDGSLRTTSWGENGDVPVAGNWDGTGPDNIGIWRPSIGQFQLRTDNGDLATVPWGEPR
ncbi:trypsin-like serine protease [Kitasatospora purpeofusca]|uniref:trypsin-like serine protease n=1 Tax=Kitasatospora purpeofusca TaxID=67352 RepID=UPI0036D218C1